MDGGGLRGAGGCVRVRSDVMLSARGRIARSMARVPGVRTLCLSMVFLCENVRCRWHSMIDDDEDTAAPGTPRPSTSLSLQRAPSSRSYRQANNVCVCVSAFWA